MRARARVRMPSIILVNVWYLMDRLMDRMNFIHLNRHPNFVYIAHLRPDASCLCLNPPFCHPSISYFPAHFTRKEGTSISPITVAARETGPEISALA